VRGYLLVATTLLWVDSWTRFGKLVKFFMASVAIPGAIAIYQQAGFWSLGVILPLPLVQQLSSYLVAQDNSLFGASIYSQLEYGVSRSASTMVDANFSAPSWGASLLCVWELPGIGASRKGFAVRAAPLFVRSPWSCFS